VAGTVEFSGDDIIPWILKIWAGLALFSWIFGMLRGKYFGPKPAKKLGKKIRLACLASLIFAGLIVVFYFLPGGSNAGGPLEIIFPISIMTILLILVTIWGLTVSHVIGLLHGVLDSIGADNQQNDLVKTTV
jgi:fatty acid desaturase